MNSAQSGSTATRGSGTSSREWREHWPLVFASFLGASMMSLGLSTLGTFIGPLEQEFGWKRAEISGGLALFSIAGIVLAPLLGGAVDRWGPRRFAVPGVLVCGAAFAAFGTVSGAILHWIALWAAFAIAAQIPRPLIWSAAISSEFTASRGVAMAVAFSGGSVGGFVAPILAGQLIDGYGWRTAYAVIGLGWGGVASIACYFFFYGRSDRMRAASVQQVTPVPKAGNKSVAASFASPTFLKLAISTLLANTILVALLVHMIPMLSGFGLDRQDAIWFAASISICAIPTKLICGALADRVQGNLISAVAVAMLALACGLLLAKSASPLYLAIPVILVGIAGGERLQMLPYLVTRYFGLSDFGKLFGVIAALMALSAGLGPILAGYVYDATGSYRLLLQGGLVAGVVAAVLIISLGRYPEEDNTQSEPVQNSRM